MGKCAYAGAWQSKDEPVMDREPPMSVNGKVPPRRLTNIARRPREYLTADEVEQLMTLRVHGPAAMGSATPP